MSDRNTCGLCGLPISPVVDIEDDDGQHYHRVCNVVSASTLYRTALVRIAELEADRALKAEAIHDLVDRAEQAEAALAKFKSQLCDGCGLDARKEARTR